jgi:hypothetical protein
MIELNAKEELPRHDQDHPAIDPTPDRMLAFMAKLFGAFTAVDPRVITQQERRSGRATFGL